VDSMKRSRIVGLCLVAVLALSATAAASASAAPMPIYKTCKKVAKGTGKLGNKTCTEAGGKEDYELGEWNEGKEKEPKLKGKDGASTLKGYIKGIGVLATVTCAKSKDEGTITGPSESTLTVTFEKCSGEEKVCTTAGAKAGDIVTKPLAGLLILVSKEPAVVGILLKGATSPVYAEFSCGVNEFVTRGSDDGEVLPLNAVGKEFKYIFKTNAGGENVISSEEGGVAGEDTLLTELKGVGVFESGEETTATFKTEEMEIVPA
jgi:hypothetical protein